MAVMSTAICPARSSHLCSVAYGPQTSTNSVHCVETASEQAMMYVMNMGFTPGKVTCVYHKNKCASRGKLPCPRHFIQANAAAVPAAFIGTITANTRTLPSMIAVIAFTSMVSAAK